MQKLIITADDYGMCKSVNDAINEGVEKGTITSVNVMMNMPFFAEAQKLVVNNRISIGIHWNITAGKPISNISDIPTLVDPDGNFYSYDCLKKRIANGVTKKADIITELEAQYDLFVKTFLCCPVYWNTHQNSSLIRGLFPLFCKLGNSLNIPCTRTFVRCYLDLETLSGKRRLREFAVSKACLFLFRVYGKKYFLCPDRRIITFTEKPSCNLSVLVRAIKKTNQGSIIEYVCHPSTIPNNPFFGSISQKRVEEYNFIRDEKNQLISTLNANQIEIVSYKVLTKESKN